MAGSLYDDRALVRERTERSRIAVKAVGILGLGGALALQASASRTVTHWALTVALLVMAGYSAFTHRELHRGVRADSTVVHGVGLTAAVVNLAAIAHMGVLSIVCVVLVLIVFYRGQLDRRGPAWAAYVLCTGGYAALIALSCLGFLPLTDSSPPLVRHNPETVLVLGVFMEIMLALTFLLATMFRRSTVSAMEALSRAQREIGRRDALLEEFRADLRQARDLEKLGRFTGHAVGPYLAHDVIGRGAYAEVYYAKHGDTGEPVALKVLYAHQRNEERRVKRFEQEVALGRSLSSPHLVRVVDSGQADDGTPYIAFELLRGRDLSELLREHQRLPLEDVLTLVSHVALALELAHAGDIVHGDVKPQNLFRVGDAHSETWKLLDFGGSMRFDEARVKRWEPMIGTPAYQSAEQAAKEPIDARSDVCSLALVAYRALTGKAAFTGADASTVAYHARFTMPADPASLAPIGRDVAMVLAVGFAKDPAQRFGSAKDFAAALQAAARNRLDPALRARAQRLLREFPWGSSRDSQGALAS